MNKGRSFTIVFLVSTVSWALLGYVLHLFFSSISILVFLTIGLLAGIFLGTLLTFIREDVPAQPSVPEPDSIVDSDSNTPPPALRSNASSKNNPSS